MTTEAKAREKGAITLNILGREFRVSCPDGEERSLQACADYLNKKLREARDTGKVVGNERIAIMAALNIAHESLSTKTSGAALDAAAFRRRIVAMQETIDSALAADQEKLF